MDTVQISLQQVLVRDLGFFFFFFEAVNSQLTFLNPRLVTRS